MDPWDKKRNKQEQESSITYINQFLNQREESTTLEQIVSIAIDGDTKILEDAVMSFFSLMRVGSNESQEDLPKRGTLECYRSHLKCYILDLSHGSIDLGSKGMFPHLDKFFSGLWKKLKEHGRGDTNIKKVTLTFYILFVHKLKN